MKTKCLAVGIILLFIGTVIIPSSGQKTDRVFLPMSRGNTLYVGGSGPGNYTTIQDAINASVDGDTVFVYYDSSPYRENILINKSISLIGENRNTTILGNNSYCSIQIIHDKVNLSKFSLSNNGYCTVVIKNCKFVNISNCIFYWSIYKILTQNVQNSTFFYNCFVPWGGADCMILSNSSGNHVRNNFFENYYGLIVCNGSDNNLICQNCFISMFYQYGLKLTENAGRHNTFSQNNFYAPVLSSVQSSWDRNYWYNWIGLKIKLLFWFPKIVTFRPLNVDRHPALKPCNITVPEIPTELKEGDL